MKKYSFLENELLVNGIPLSGFADGEAIVFSRRVDQITDVVGADGQMSIAINADKSGSAIIRLQQTSASNAVLGAIVGAVDAGAFIPVTLQNFNTDNAELMAGSQGFIRKHADAARGSEITNQEWEVIVENLFMLTGTET